MDVQLVRSRIVNHQPRRNAGDGIALSRGHARRKEALGRAADFEFGFGTWG